MLIGDLVKQITTKIGLKSCIPCQNRQQKMNQFHLNLNEKLKTLQQKFTNGSADSEQ